jgi:hypothetical protein
VKESFEEYKKTIEDNLINFTYLYDGDVIDSEIRYYEEIRNNNKVSPNFIIDCIKKIYDESIEIMFKRDCKEITIVKERFTGITDVVNKLNTKKFDPTYIFVSNNFYDLPSSKDRKPFPDYFYKQIIFTAFGYDVYKTPLILDEKDDMSVYITNKSIQSLVYGIQNMEYNIECHKMGYKHTIKYNLYNCDYDVYKLNIKDLSKIRDEKINDILNGENN